MRKRNVVIISGGIGIWCVLSVACMAIQLLTKDTALDKVFGPGAQIITENRQLTDAQVSKIKERLGGQLVHMQKGSKSTAVEESTNMNFYFKQKDGKKTGVAIIDKEPGKWGPVEFIIALDLEGVVTQVEVLSYQEKQRSPDAGSV